MRLPGPFLKLPIRFDADALAAEVRALPPSAWSAHPTGFAGNEAVRLVSPGGRATDETDGVMAPTPALQQSPYMREVMAEIGAVWGRSRLMGLAAGGEVPRHIDTHYYWRTHWRIHIPVITNPGVLFTCGDETVHMAAGECWLFDSFQWHRVENKGAEQRIHLVLDTVGGGQLPDLIDQAQSGGHPKSLKPGQRKSDGLVFERLNAPRVMSPWEMRCHVAFLSEHAVTDPLLPKLFERVERFIDDWTAAWTVFGVEEAGRPAYEALLMKLRADLSALGGEHLQLKNGWPLNGMLDTLLFQMALGNSQPRPA
jgi:hypothetical protein